MARRNPELRAFIRIKDNGEVIPGSVVLRKKKPSEGRWYEIPQNVCCTSTSTTTVSTREAPSEDEAPAATTRTSSRTTTRRNA